MSVNINANLDKTSTQEFWAQKWWENKKLQIGLHQSIFGFDKSKQFWFETDYRAMSSSGKHLFRAFKVL